ncbi:nodulation protein NfeD [Alkalihalobacillus sp. LMS6]|uniref:NfeD family protein n=1 Tax=Alkalihalobacillus sp. LMS6 TaxID=2924034 RepID=UPI00159B8739|nr:MULTISPECIES: NfeD family protein [Bacillaceae]UTR08474.1 nodulation protein NfeD [Alkalihalobacillus sp. LMS6]
MDWLDSATVGFLVVTIGTLFLIGELLVRARGLFGLLGLGLISVYFLHHLNGDASTWVIIFYLIGLALIIFDGNVTSDGTIAAIGVLFMIIGLAVPAPDMVYSILVGMGTVIGAFASLLFLKVFPHRNMWSKMTLKESLSSEAGYNSINEGYKELVGKKGKALTAFRPTGTVEIDGEPYSATSGSVWIEAETEVDVVSVDGTRILVRRAEQKQQTQPEEEN